MIGHVLRMSGETPARSSKEFAIIGLNQEQRGRHNTHLFDEQQNNIPNTGL